MRRDYPGVFMNDDVSPVVHRRRLRLELRKARLHIGLTQEEVARRMDWSLSKIIRIETGSVSVSTNDLTALLRLYRVDNSERVEELVARGRAARQHAWWSRYRHVLPPGYLQYIEHEMSASVIRSYKTLIMPDLLQTKEYTTAAIQPYGMDSTTEEIMTCVEVVMERQEWLSRAEPPLLFFVLDEAVIRRLAGDGDSRQAQLEKLIRMAGKPRVTIEVISFDAGIHRGMADNFSILEFSDPMDYVLFIEGAGYSLFDSNASEEVLKYRELFEDLRQRSLGSAESLSYLREIAQNIG